MKLIYILVINSKMCEDSVGENKKELEVIFVVLLILLCFLVLTITSN